MRTGGKRYGRKEKRMKQIIWSSRVDIDEWTDYIKDEVIPQFYKEEVGIAFDMFMKFPFKEDVYSSLHTIERDLDLSRVDVQKFIDEHWNYVYECVQKENEKNWKNEKSNSEILDVSAGGYIVIVSEYNSDLGERRYGHRITEETMIGNVLCEHTLPLLSTTFYLESNKDGLELKSRDDCYGGWCTYTYRVLKPDLSDAEIKEFDELLMKDCKPSKELLDKYTNPLGEKVQKIYGFPALSSDNAKTNKQLDTEGNNMENNVEKQGVWAVNIEWDTDGENVDLPKEVCIPDEIVDKANEKFASSQEQMWDAVGNFASDLSDAISDYLSDTYGFTHKGFTIYTGAPKEASIEHKSKKGNADDFGNR